MLLGPAGIGLIGILYYVMAMAATLAGMGLGRAGTRQIAEAAEKEDPAEMAATRRALFWITLTLAVLGAALLWLLREPIAGWVLGGTAQANDIGWLGIGVALMVASASQGALLNGLRHIGDLSRISMLSAILSTSLGVGALWLFDERGLLVFIIAGPFANFVIGHLFVARLPRIAGLPTPMRMLMGQWRTLARFGFPVMLAGLVGFVANLIVRALVQKDLGLQAVGYFEASWTISGTYLGFVLGAMGADFYPRLTGVIRDHEHANRLVNEQTQVALLLAGPMLLAMLALAPWIITLLYANSFAPAALILRWQVLGDVLKMVSWPLVFLILAAGDGRTFLITEALGMGVFAFLCFVGLPWFGVEATGIAFLLMFVFYLPLVYWLARRRTGFAWHRAVVWQVTSLMFFCALTFALAWWIPLAGAVFGCLASIVFGVHALARLAHMVNLGGAVGRLGKIADKIMRKLGLAHS